MRRRTRWAPEAGRKEARHLSWGGHRASPRNPDGTKSPAVCNIPEFCRKCSVHIRTGASSPHSSPENGGYAWHPPYSGFVPYLSPSLETGSPGKRSCLSESGLRVICSLSVSVCADTGWSVSRQGQARLPRCQGIEGSVHHPRS